MLGVGVRTFCEASSLLRLVNGKPAEGRIVPVLPAFLIPSFRHPSSSDLVFRMYRLSCTLITRRK